MRAARRNYSVAAMPSLIKTRLERWIPPFRGLSRDRDKYLAFGKKQVMEKMEREKTKARGEASRNDIFSVLLNAVDPYTDQRIPMPELWMESNTLIVAGSDTSST